MADYSGEFLEIEIYQGYGYPPPPEPPNIIQRIWDTGAGWCQFTDTTFNPTPAPDDTEPNHTNNLVASTHHILGEYT